MDTVHNTERSCFRVTRVMMFLLMSCFVVIIFLVTEDGGDKKLINPNDQDQNRLPIIEAVKSLFSLPPSCDYWLFKIRAFLHQSWCFYFPHPNLDFRRGVGENEVGSKEKVRDAVIKSLDTSKSALEDSAKSAADKTVDKLKRTLSGSENNAAEDDGQNTQV